MWSGRIEENILYEDREILVCQKPAGAAVQNARVGVMDMESAVKNYLAGKTPAKASAGIPEKVPYLGIIHRLDQPVEGVLVFAKTPRAAGELSRQIAAGEMDKNYLAVTFQRPPDEEGILEDYLKKDGRTNTSSVALSGTPGAKKARLTYRLLEEAEARDGKKYLLSIHLETGRHHQIRVQMAHHGMPLLGDCKYGSREPSGMSLGLCANSLEFCHPSTKKKIKFTAAPRSAAFQGFTRTE